MSLLRWCFFSLLFPWLLVVIMNPSHMYDSCLWSIISPYLVSIWFSDINELNLPKTCTTRFDDPDDLLNFKISIAPDEVCVLKSLFYVLIVEFIILRCVFWFQGIYKGGKFTFSFKVGPSYPHEPPKVKCETPVYHPNIDLEGNVCLNILREDWKPVLTINSIVYGLQYLFLVSVFPVLNLKSNMNIYQLIYTLHLHLKEPNPEDPLNKEAAEVLQSNRRVFEQNVQKAMRGGYVGSVFFERCLK